MEQEKQLQESLHKRQQEQQVVVLALLAIPHSVIGYRKEKRLHVCRNSRMRCKISRTKLLR